MNNIADIQKLLEKLLEMIGFQDINVLVSEEQDGAVVFNINTADSALLIGRGGENLIALQYVLYIILVKKIQELPKFSLDVNNYRRDKKNKIEEMARLAAQKAENSGHTELLMPMTSYERKIVHEIVSQFPNLATQSIGEEPNKRVLIKNK